jgi:hypothetical protein
MCSMFTLPSRSQVWTLPTPIFRLDQPARTYTRNAIEVTSTMTLANNHQIPVDDNNRKAWTHYQRDLASNGMEARSVSHLQQLVCLATYIIDLMLIILNYSFRQIFYMMCIFIFHQKFLMGKSFLLL